MLGLCELEKVPSPKDQDHDVGAPVERSVNETIWPTSGEEGEKVKSAVGGEPPPPVETTTECMTGELEPLAFEEVSVTEYVLAEANTCDGFCNVDVLLPPDAGSPKFQDQDVGAPEDVSAKLTLCPAVGEGGANVKFAVGGEPPPETTTA